MNIKSITAFASAAAVLASSAFASDALDACESARAAAGQDASICSCVIDAIGGNEELLDEIITLAEISDPEERAATASSELSEAMASCS